MILLKIPAMKNILLFISFITSVVITNGQKPVDYLMKGKALVEAGKPDEAISILSQGLETFSESSIYLARAEAFMAKGDYSMAIDDFNSANKIAPSSGEYGLARIYGLKGNAATTVYHLELCLKSPYKKSEKEILLDPSFSLVEYTPEWRQFWKKESYGVPEKGVAEVEYYVSTGNKAEARAVLAGLSGNYQGHSSTVYAGALISFAEAKYPETLRALNGLLAQEPGNEKYLRLLARVQEASGNHVGASSSYTTLLNLNIPDPELLILRAECYRRTGETTKALDDIRRYLDLYPGNRKALSFAGKVEMAAGDNLKALAYFSENLKLHSNDAECYIDRADSYFVSRSWDWAIKDYSMSLDIQPGNSDVWLNKGIALLNSGRKDDACFDFRKSFNLGNRKATEYLSRHCIK
jgi:tetratricopeptide (TPR) repeat protein